MNSIKLSRNILAVLCVAPVVAQAGSPLLCKHTFVTPWMKGPKIESHGAPAGAGKHVQFGFESEFTLPEAGPLLEVYKPQSIPAETWKAMTQEQKLAWAKQNFGHRPEYAEDSGLRKFTTDPELKFLPEMLIVDSTGNFEIVIPPMETLHDLERTVAVSNRRFGPGSMQAMLSTPSEAFFGQLSGKSRTVAVQENIGWLNFTNELDTFLKLRQGAERYAKAPTKQAARSFQHQWLGPMTKMKRDKMVRYMNENSQGRLLDKDSLKVIKNDASFKYFGGLAYRPDVAVKVGRIAFEERSAHNDPDLLIGQATRDTKALSKDRSNYARFANAPAFDSVADFAKLPSNVQDLLKEVYPSKADPRFDYAADDLLALEVFRNFSYPVRNWGPWLEMLGADATQKQTVAAAQRNYVSKLESIERKYRGQEIDKEQAIVAVQGALVEFSSDTKIDALFARYAVSK